MKGQEVINSMLWSEPQRWQALMLNLDINIEALKMFRTWLYFTPTEREIFADDYPEMCLLNDSVIKEMQLDLLACLN